jgi:hypothetical protein
MGGSGQVPLLPRRTGTMKLCSFEARSKGQPWPLLSQAAETLLWHSENSIIRASRTTADHRAGCSKMPSSKAATSEEARTYLPHFVWTVRPCNGSWRTDPSRVLPTSEELLLNVADLSEARTPLADFFNSLLELVLRHAIPQCIAGDFEEPACFGNVAACAL